MEDIQSWWEVPSIAYFCSLFRTAFNLLDFDIEELEEALLTDGTEECASSLLTELIVRLLNGCLGNNDISAFNYQMYLRRLFRRKCQETGRYNPFNTDIDFQFLPLRSKVEILYALCDFRLDADDIFDLFKNLEAESLRVEPLGYDDNDSAYWYFYGTRLYREDYVKRHKGKNKKKRGRDSRRRGLLYGDDWLDDDCTGRVWQVVCFTEEDWTHLTDKFSKATSKSEKELYRSLSQNFLPEIPRLFQEKERLQRKRLLELAPRRTSSRVLQKIKQKVEDNKDVVIETKEKIIEKEKREKSENDRKIRAKRRDLLRSQSTSSESPESDQEMPQKTSKRPKSQDKKSKHSSATHKGEPPPIDLPIKTGRKTNNSLACAVGQILIPDEEPQNSTRKKLKTSQIFSQTEEDVQTDMYKVLEQLLAHDDAWPFMDPVEEEYAPNYYAVIRRPMDLRKMEERLDSGYYTDFSMFKADFKLIVNNCRLYNGQDNEYTVMVDNLQAAFDRLTEKYIHRISSSDEEIAVEFPIPTPSRKHKLKTSESSAIQKSKKRKTNSESTEKDNSGSDKEQHEIKDNVVKKKDKEHDVKKKDKLKDNVVIKKDKNKDNAVEKKDKIKDNVVKKKDKLKDGKLKKKRKGHHRHGKHSKNHKKNSHHKSQHGKSSKHSKKEKHSKGKNKESKKSKHNKKKIKTSTELSVKSGGSRCRSVDSAESSPRSRSASPLPSIHTLSPSAAEDSPSPPPDPNSYKDKYDKIKERRRNAPPTDAWDSLVDHKHNTNHDKHKHSLHLPGKEKNQKLRETIEKLKAKNEKYKENTLFNKLFSSGQSDTSNKDSYDKDDDDSNYSDEEKCSIKTKNKTKTSKRLNKKSTTKNESASEALEQAVKDISKWLTDGPKDSNVSSPCDSLTQTTSTEEQDSRLDDEFAVGDKHTHGKKDARKRPSSRELKVVKRQRTIDRLQPGKSKGNLLTNIASKTTEKIEEVAPLGPLTKAKDSVKADESSPKLSLGSVLPTVGFTLGNDHEFGKSKTKENEDSIKPKPIPQPETDKVEKVLPSSSIETPPVEAIEEEKPKEEETVPPKPSQEKATPNLSAWFKAFGAPKSTPAVGVKKKTENTEHEEKQTDATSTIDNKPTSPKHTVKYDSPTDPGTPNPEGGDSPLPNVGTTPRQRRTSTASSVSERSSFSQDLDSPRHQMSHNSPLLRSPASPRIDDFQKISYPIINGTVRAGFYQDTTSVKSSPDKSTSPREGPQSPYSPYSQHVYASNNSMGSVTPNHFIEQIKSPLPTYGQSQPPFYDTSKVSSLVKARANDDYSALVPDPYSHSNYEPYSPFHSIGNQAHHEPKSDPVTTPPPATSNTINTDSKSTMFPVKKRTYNDADSTSNVPIKKVTDPKDATPTKLDYDKIYNQQSLHSIPVSTVTDIGANIEDKTDMTKLNNIKDKTNLDYIERSNLEERNAGFEREKKKEPTPDLNKPIGMTKNDNVDMINMGYMNPEIDKRCLIEPQDLEYPPKDVAKSVSNTHTKGYDIDAIAMNLGMNNLASQQKSVKTSISSSMIPPAHSQERCHTSMSQGHNMSLQYGGYDPLSTGTQSLSNFSMSDIDLANRKLYSCGNVPTSSTLDYGNWKMSNQMRKDVMPPDYSNYHPSSVDKTKSDNNSAAEAVLNYNKNMNLQHQYHNYNIPKSAPHRQSDLQQNMSSELRIPNPRGHLKNDNINVASSMGSTDMMAKNTGVTPKSQKSDKLIQNPPLVSSMSYKTPYSAPHPAMPLDSLRNFKNIPDVLERYTNDSQYLQSFAAGAGASLYHDKTFQMSQMAQMSQMFNKNMCSTADVHPTSSTANIYSSSCLPTSKDNTLYKTASIQPSAADVKNKNKRKRTTDTKPAQMMSTQSYHTSTCNSDVLSSVKSSMVPGSAFNFGASPNLGLGGGLYGDNTGFSIEELRNTNQLMAANYMAAAAVAHQRSTTESGEDKNVGLVGRGQMRSYGFEASTYQQYLQRHQEELLRQTGAQIMGLYPPGYPLSSRQPYDSINRRTWL